MPAIGFFGEKLDLNIRRGASFGPVRAEMVNPDDTPVNLTNCVIRGHIRKNALDTIRRAVISVTITEAAAGKYEFWLDADALKSLDVGESVSQAASKYVWDLELVDSTGRITPLYYGDVLLLREVTRV